MTLTVFKSNRSPSLSDTITVDGVAFNLTGSTVKLQMRLATSSTLKVDSAAVVVSAPAGTVRYDWAAVDVDTPGMYVAWWRVTLPSSLIQDSPEFTLFVEDHAPASTLDLCTIADVRTNLSIETTDDDQLIQTLITRLSAVFNEKYGRDFAPITSATRTVAVDGYLVDLGSYDLNTPTSVVIHPESSATTLTLDVGYALEPIGGDQRLGTYYRVALAPSVNLWSSAAINFGRARLRITGSWGPTTVPDDIRYAAIVTVASNMDRSIEAYALQSGDPRVVEPARFGGWSIPTAAHMIMSAYQRRYS